VIANHCERTDRKAPFLLAALAFVINYDQGMIKSTELLVVRLRPKNGSAQLLAFKVRS